MKRLIVSVFTALIALAAAPAAAAPLTWEQILPPMSNGQINHRVNWVGPIEKAINGDLYAAVGLGDDPTTDDEDYEVIVYKSTNFGRTWTETDGQPFNSEIRVSGWEGVIFDIECSSTDANILYVTEGCDIYKSSNGGSRWVTLDNLFEEEALDIEPEGLIVSIAIGYVGGTAYLFAATSTFGNGRGGAFVLQESIFVSQWIDLEVATEREDTFGLIDVLAIDTLPDFSTSQGIVAVVCDYTQGMTFVTTRFMGGQWGEAASDCILMYNTGSDQDFVDATLLDAVIWMPSDFSSDAESGNMVFFLGINPRDEEDIEQGDIFHCFFGAPEEGPVPAYDLDVRGNETGTAVSDVDGAGAWQDADILISGYTNDIAIPHTWATQDGGLTWFQDAKRPTGGLSPLFPRALSSLRVHPDFATNGQALVGTHGLDAGLSISYLPTDVCTTGFTWNTIYFISICTDREAGDWLAPYGKRWFWDLLPEADS